MASFSLIISWMRDSPQTLFSRSHSPTFSPRSGVEEGRRLEYHAVPVITNHTPLFFIKNRDAVDVYFAAVGIVKPHDKLQENTLSRAEGL